MKFLRLSDLIARLDEESVLEGVTRLATHSWDLNPYSYFGPDKLARAHSGIGYGALVLVWWVCNSSLLSFGPSTSASYWFFSALFGIVGLASMFSVQRGYVVILTLAGLDQELKQIMLSTRIERGLMVWAGLILGASFAYATIRTS